MERLPAATAFALAFFVFAFLFLAAPVIPDADSYYHLAVAREYASHGYMQGLPWARMSVLGTTFGDKEFLFHALLAEFVSGSDAATRGRLVLALFNAAFAAAMTGFATRALGWWSLAVPVWLYAAAPMLTFRLIRLRPEHAALLLLLLIVHLAYARRSAWLAVAAAVFALSYTAFHVVIGLAVLWAVATWREREWQLPLAATIGSAAGLILHPGFPGNLRIWWIQNVLFFAEKSRLDVGSEIAPAAAHTFLLDNLGWWCGIAVLAFASRDARAERRLVIVRAIPAAVFAILTVLMQRMAIYFVPLATLTLFARLDARPPARRAAVALALLAASLLSFRATRNIHHDLLIDSGFEADAAAFGRAVPRNAKVAAHWGHAELYTFFAPQGRYLNVLDPIFMALPYPQVYAAQRRLFEGGEADVPDVTTRLLDSDLLAFPSQSPVFDRVHFDPRIVPVYNGFTFLGRIDPTQTARFVRDWNGYRPASPAAAYIDARMVSRERCVQFLRDETVTAAATRIYELASWGSAELRIDADVRVAARPSRAMLGKGTLFRTQLGPGTHRFVVTTCAADDGGNGFYLLRRDRTRGESR